MKYSHSCITFLLGSPFGCIRLPQRWPGHGCMEYEMNVTCQWGWGLGQWGWGLGRTKLYTTKLIPCVCTTFPGTDLEGLHGISEWEFFFVRLSTPSLLTVVSCPDPVLQGGRAVVWEWDWATATGLATYPDPSRTVLRSADLDRRDSAVENKKKQTRNHM